MFVTGPLTGQGEQYVARLHITMNQSGGMRGVQSIAYGRQNCQYPLRFKRSMITEDNLQVATTYITHRDIQQTSRFARLIDRDYVRMVQ